MPQPATIPQPAVAVAVAEEEEEAAFESNPAYYNLNEHYLLFQDIVLVVDKTVEEK
jgi:hypothetical protein